MFTEARPVRKVLILNPENYTGNIDSHSNFIAPSLMDSSIKYDNEVLWQMADEVNIVNDNIYRADSTFIYKDMEPIDLKEDD